MPFKMRFERRDGVLKAVAACHLERGKQGIRNLCHSRSYDHRLSIELVCHDAADTLEGGNVADRRAAEFHYDRKCCSAHLSKKVN